MTEIYFTQADTNIYETCEKQFTPPDNLNPVSLTIRGWHYGHVFIAGDVIHGTHFFLQGSFTVDEVLEQRDALGVFTGRVAGQEKNSYFKLKLSRIQTT